MQEASYGNVSEELDGGEGCHSVNVLEPLCGIPKMKTHT